MVAAERAARIRALAEAQDLPIRYDPNHGLWADVDPTWNQIDPSLNAFGWRRMNTRQRAWITYMRLIYRTEDLRQTPASAVESREMAEQDIAEMLWTLVHPAGARPAGPVINMATPAVGGAA